MEILLLNESFIRIAIIDNFKSFIWTDNYCDVGDFELCIPLSEPVVSDIYVDYYLQVDTSDRLMIIEDFQITTDPTTGDQLLVTGRSFESVLERRIVWEHTVLTGDLQTSVATLLNSNMISPTDPDRGIENISFVASTDPLITALTYDFQLWGENLLNVIQTACEEKGIGFRIVFTSAGTFEISLYAGADRSYSQIANPYVIFSPNFENIMNTTYVYKKRNMKTVTLVTGEGDGSDRLATTANDGESPAPTGIARREIYTDAGDISKTYDGGTLSDAAYLLQLEQRGRENLAENSPEESFEGSLDTTRMFGYRQDYYLGDIVQFEDAYGHEGKVQIVSVIHSQSVSGIEVYPTFKAVV